MVENWGAIEEVLLLDAVEQDGIGNWYGISFVEKKTHFKGTRCVLYLLGRILPLMLLPRQHVVSCPVLAMSMLANVTRSEKIDHFYFLIKTR